MRIFSFVLILSAALVGLEAEPAPSLSSIDATLARIAPHARNYPPRFSSPTERQSIEEDLRKVIARLDAFVADHPDDPDFLLRDGFANAMGHNLDFENCAQRSAKTFEHLLMLRPDDKMANLHYGAFLGGVGKAKESIRYLGKAVELGATEANYSLAIAYLMLEDKEQAAQHLKIYVSLNPRDNGAKRLLAGIESTDLKFERKEGKPSVQTPAPTAPGGRGSP